MDLNFRRDSETGNLHVDGEAPCGAQFKDVAIVIDPISENPGLILDKPLGLLAVKAILDYVERGKIKCENLN